MLGDVAIHQPAEIHQPDAPVIADAAGVVMRKQRGFDVELAREAGEIPADLGDHGQRGGGMGPEPVELDDGRGEQDDRDHGAEALPAGKAFRSRQGQGRGQNEQPGRGHQEAVFAHPVALGPDHEEHMPGKHGEKHHAVGPVALRGGEKGKRQQQDQAGIAQSGKYILPAAAKGVE